MAPDPAAAEAPPTREPEQLPLPAAGVRYLLELALRTQLGEAWWAGFTTAHGAPAWVAEKRYALRLGDAAVVPQPAAPGNGSAAG